WVTQTSRFRLWVPTTGVAVHSSRNHRVAAGSSVVTDAEGMVPAVTRAVAVIAKRIAGRKRRNRDLRAPDMVAPPPMRPRKDYRVRTTCRRLTIVTPAPAGSRSSLACAVSPNERLLASAG